MNPYNRREVVFCVYDDVVLLDLAGPLQVLHGAGAYHIRLASPNGQPVHTDTGVPVGVELALPDVRAPVDTLIVPGPAPPIPDRFPSELIIEVRRIGSLARRAASVCSGAFLLAEAGLLTNRRATTHWFVCAELAMRYPDVSVEPDALFVRDGPVVTSAGVTAGIDMALALVEEDHGPDLARTIARHLVVFLQRPGGQSQFSVWNTGRTPRHAPLRAVLDAVAAEPAGNHSLPAMAARAMVSERHLTRLFQRELGHTPGQYVTRVRLEAAQTLLESGDAEMDAVARMSGFGSDETMRRCFLQVFGITPGAYRQRFRAPASPSNGAP
ncbi:MAG: GlxA family transcriptional regulator [Pseudonocardiaceae bacterium]